MQNWRCVKPVLCFFCWRKMSGNTESERGKPTLNLASYPHEGKNPKRSDCEHTILWLLRVQQIKMNRKRSRAIVHSDTSNWDGYANRPYSPLVHPVRYSEFSSVTSVRIKLVHTPSKHGVALRKKKKTLSRVGRSILRFINLLCRNATNLNIRAAQMTQREAGWDFSRCKSHLDFLTRMCRID